MRRFIFEESTKKNKLAFLQLSLWTERWNFIWHGRWKSILYILRRKKKITLLGIRESEAIAVTLRDTDLYLICLRATPWSESKNTWKYYQFLMSKVVQTAGCVNWECGTFGAFRKRVNCFWCSLILSLGEILPCIWFWVAMCYYIFMPLNMYLLQFYAAHFHDVNCLSLLRDICVFSQDHIKWEKYGK